jgi:hypothetical protein
MVLVCSRAPSGSIPIMSNKNGKIRDRNWWLSTHGGGLSPLWLPDPSAPRLGHMHAEDDGDSEQYRIVYHFPNGEKLVLLNCPHALRHTKIVLALQELTERERLVVTLDLYEGLGLREIAFVLEMLPSAVIELQAAAIQHLNTVLGRT